MKQLNKRLYDAYGWKVQYVRKQKKLAKKQKLDIYKSALIRLKEDGFKIKQKGSKYIAKLIEALYHERELLKLYSKRASFEGYWNLKDIYNPHYFELGDGKEIIDAMRKSIINSYEKDDCDLNELIYFFADKEILVRNYLYQDDPRYSAKNAMSYKKELKKYYNE